jgi:hypothetical protein
MASKTALISRSSGVGGTGKVRRPPEAEILRIENKRKKRTLSGRD